MRNFNGYRYRIINNIKLLLAFHLFNHVRVYTVTMFNFDIKHLADLGCPAGF